MATSSTGEATVRIVITAERISFNNITEFHCSPPLLKTHHKLTDQERPAVNQDKENQF